MVLKGSEMVMRVGLWKTIRKEWYFIRGRVRFSIRNERGVKFWKDGLSGDSSLEESFLSLFSLAIDKDA